MSINRGKGEKDAVHTMECYAAMNGVRPRAATWMDSVWRATLSEVSQRRRHMTFLIRGI